MFHGVSEEKSLNLRFPAEEESLYTYPSKEGRPFLFEPMRKKAG
jgi:hypothetical protein